MRSLIAALIALMLFAAKPVAAADKKDGDAAFKAGDVQKAFRLWKRLAERLSGLAIRRQPSGSLGLRGRSATVI